MGGGVVVLGLLANCCSSFLYIKGSRPFLVDSYMNSPRSREKTPELFALSEIPEHNHRNSDPFGASSSRFGGFEGRGLEGGGVPQQSCRRAEISDCGLTLFGHKSPPTPADVTRDEGPARRAIGALWFLVVPAALPVGTRFPKSLMGEQKGGTVHCVEHQLSEQPDFCDSEGSSLVDPLQC